MVKLDPADKGQADLLYATFLGRDSRIGIGYAVTMDSPGKIYLTGANSSGDLPIR